MRCFLRGLSFLVEESQFLFIIATIVFVASLLLTMTSAKEMRYKPKKKEIIKFNGRFFYN